MIHRFTQNGLRFALDTPSGSIHIVDEAVYDVIDLFPQKSRAEIIELFKDKHGDKVIAEALDEIGALVKEGLLFSRDRYENIPLERAGAPVVKALCLHIAHDCNLACAYCFADSGAFSGRRALMSPDTARAAVDFLIKHSGNRKNLEIDFFGGEPLMNLEAIKAAVDYARSKETTAGKRFNFTLTTNGTLLNPDSISYIAKNMDNVVLSLDGRKAVNDKMRKTKSGGGSYDMALPNFKALTKKMNYENYYIRATFTAHNTDFVNDALNLCEQGFKRISAEPVVAPRDCDYAINNKHINAICAEYDRLTEEMLKTKGDFLFFHYNIDLTGGPCVYKRLAGCGAGVEYLCAAPDGSLYPCHQLAGRLDYLLGDIFKGITNNALRDTFSRTNVYQKEGCRDCFAMFFCGGGCAAASVNINNDINKPYEIGCTLQRKRIECAIAYNYRLTN